MYLATLQVRLDTRISRFIDADRSALGSFQFDVLFAVGTPRSVTYNLVRSFRLQTNVKS